MSSDELNIIRQGLDRLGDKVGGLAIQNNNLEIAVRALLQRTNKHEKILRVAQVMGFVAAGALVGTGIVQLGTLLSLILH